MDQYIRNFTWNKVKYRSEKSIGELIDSLHKVSLIISPLTFFVAVPLEESQTDSISPPRK